MQESLNHLRYKEYTSVSVIPYIPRDSDVEFVLLRDLTTGKVTEVNGQCGEIDACSLFTAARSLLRETGGLFTATNLQTGGAKGLKSLPLRKPEHYNCNLILNEPEYDRLLKQMVRTAEHVNVAANTKVIVLPVADLDLKAFNEYLKENKVNKEVVTVSAVGLTAKKDLGLEPSTQEYLGAVMGGLFASIPFTINESKRKHYAVMTCFDPSTTSRMYDHCEYLLQGQLRRQDESWHYYKVALGEYPDLSLLEKLDGIIIPGAAGNCYNPELTWIPKLEEFIRHIYKNTKIRYLGLCYGAQILAQALGGKVERNHRVGFKAANEEVTLTDDFFELPYVKSHTSLYTRRPKTLCIVKSHGDIITRLPEDATLLAYSETSKNEIFSVGDRFFGTQGHPEYTSDFVCSRDWTNLISESEDSVISDYENYKKNRLEKNYAIKEEKYDLRSICTNFLKKVE